MTLADKWHLSWWEWHLLLTVGVRLRRLQRVRAVPAGGQSSAGLFDAIAAGRDHPPDPGRVRGGARGAGHRPAGAERGGRGRRGSPRGWPSGSASPRGRPRCSTGPARRWPPSGTCPAGSAALVAVGRAGPGRRRRGASSCAGAASAVRPAYGDVEIGLVSDGVTDGRRPAVPTRPSTTRRSPLHGQGQASPAVGSLAGAPTVRPATLRATLASQLSIAPGERPALPRAGHPVPPVHVARTWRPPCWPIPTRPRSAVAGRGDRALRRPARLHHLLRGGRAGRDRRRCSTGTTAPRCPASSTTAARSCSSSATRCWPCSTRPPGRPTTRRGRCGPPWRCRRRSERDRRRAARTGRGSGSAPTPGRRWSATSAASCCAASTRWATPSTSPPGCRRSPSPARSSSARATLDARRDGGQRRAAR